MEIPFGHVENNVLFRSAFGEVGSLPLKEIMEEELSAEVAHYSARFEKFKSRLDQIEEKINTQANKGSFLSSLLNIKTAIPTHEGLGDYAALLEKVAGLESLLNDYILKNRQKNTQIKQALLLELDAILQNNDHQEAFELIKDLRSRWLKTGTPEEAVKDALEGQFKAGLDGFFERRNAFSEDKKLLIKARIEEYQSIVAEICAYIEKKNFQDSLDRVQDLQKSWKEIGSVPTAAFKPVNEAYRNATQTYFTLHKKNRAAVQQSRAKGEKESIKEKTDLLTELSELVNSGFAANSETFEELKKRWKSSGHVSKKTHPNIHQTFIQLSRAFQERQFIWNLAQRKNKGFAKKEEIEQYKDLQKVIRELLKRDENELHSFQENLEKMHINKGSFVEMLEAKLSAQQEKVALKKELLKECQDKIKHL